MPSITKVSFDMDAHTRKLSGHPLRYPHRGYCSTYAKILRILFLERSTLPVLGDANIELGTFVIQGHSKRCVYVRTRVRTGQ